MSRVNDIFQKLINHFSTKDIIHLHLSSSDLIVAQDGKVIYAQPSCFVYSQTDQQILATGKAALKWQASLADETKVRFDYPLKNGAVADNHLAQLYLKSIFQEILGKTKFFRGTLHWLHHDFLSPLQKQQFSQLFSQFAFMRQQAASLPSAAVINHLFDQQLSAAYQPIWVLYLDQFCCELALVKGKDCVYSQKINFCVEELLINLKNYLFIEEQLSISKIELLRILENLSLAGEIKKDRLIQIKGKSQKDKQLQVKTIVLEKIIKLVQENLISWQQEIKLQQAYYLYNHQADFGTENSQQGLLIGSAFTNFKFFNEWLKQADLFTVNHHPKPVYAGLQGLILNQNYEKD